MLILGDILFSQQKFGEAVEYYTEALDDEYFDNGFVIELLCGRGSAQSKIGNFRDAISDCNRALKLKPGYVSILLVRANCYQYLDDFISSIKDLKAALNDEEIKKNREESEKIESKIEELENALKREKAKKQKCVGDAQIKKKDFKSALQFYNEAIDLWPENTSFYEDRANCYIQMDDYRGAIKAYQSAVLIDSHFTKGYQNIIKYYLILGDIFGAEAAIGAKPFLKNEDIIKGYQMQCNSMKAHESKAMEFYNKMNYESARKPNFFLFVKIVSILKKLLNFQLFR